MARDSSWDLLKRMKRTPLLMVAHWCLMTKPKFKRIQSNQMTFDFDKGWILLKMIKQQMIN